MIRLVGVSKTFSGRGTSVKAVRNVSLSVKAGEIFGVIGFSGAGKSTLVRCINMLEKPESGEVWVDGKNLVTLPEKELRRQRSRIGMIFQHFNLFRSRTVAGNVAFPLQYRGMSREAIDARVEELLDLVGLSDKRDVYPSQLSGGQKQRVGIARALATGPRILLCDEATSALDPQTTRSILALLKELNRKLDLTMVIITHEMNVIKAISTHAVVMEQGEIVERGSVFDLFSNPSRQVTKDFIATTSSLYKVYDLLKENSPLVRLKPNQVLAHFHYVGRNSIDALISKASVKFGVLINIIFGDLDIIQETPVGGLINIVEGTPEQIETTIFWFGGRGVHVEIIRVGGEYV